MTIQVGDRLPDVPLAIATGDGPKPTTSGEYFAGKRVALFAVPGAFTPTCSARHLPSYVEKASELKDKGVDEIACISVNDPFVMRLAIPMAPPWPLTRAPLEHLTPIQSARTSPSSSRTRPTSSSTSRPGGRFSTMRGWVTRRDTTRQVTGSKRWIARRSGRWARRCSPPRGR